MHATGSNNLCLLPTTIYNNMYIIMHVKLILTIVPAQC